MSDSIAENQANQEAEKAYDASDPQQVNKARQKAGRRKATELDVIRSVMNTAQGRSWLYSILEICMIYGNPFVPGQPDSTAFNLGMSNVGKKLMQDIMLAAPEEYLKMCKEGAFKQFA